MIVLIAGEAVGMHGDVEVLESVVVVVAPGGPDIVLRHRRGDAGRGADVGEGSVTIVVHYDILGVEDEDEQVGMAVVIHVGEAGAALVGNDGDAGGGNGVGKGAVTGVVVPEMADAGDGVNGIDV